MKIAIAGNIHIASFRSVMFGLAGEVGKTDSVIIMTPVCRWAGECFCSSTVSRNLSPLGQSDGRKGAKRIRFSREIFSPSVQKTSWGVLYGLGLGPRWPYFFHALLFFLQGLWILGRGRINLIHFHLGGVDYWPWAWVLKLVPVPFGVTFHSPFLTDAGQSRTDSIYRFLRIWYIRFFFIPRAVFRTSVSASLSLRLLKMFRRLDGLQVLPIGYDGIDHSTLYFKNGKKINTGHALKDFRTKRARSPGNYPQRPPFRHVVSRNPEVFNGVYPGFHQGDKPIAHVPGKRTSPFVLSFAGIDSIKGVDRLLWAFRDIIPTRHKVRLVVCGPEVGAWRHLRDLLRLESVVELVDFIPQKEAFELMRCCLFYVHPARYESFGLSVLQAMSMGKAVVASSVGGLAGYLKPNVNACVVPLSKVSNLSRAIRRLIEDGRYRHRLEQGGLETVRHYTWRKIAPLYRNMYRSTFNGHSRL